MKIEERSGGQRVDKRPFRTLKPSEPLGGYRSTVSTLERGLTTSSSHQRCGLIQCRKLVCNLKSHRQYAALRQRAVSGNKTHSTASPPHLLQRQPSNNVLDQVVLRIARQVSDGFPVLPLQHESVSTFKELAHHYFTHQIDRLIQLYSPHLDRSKYKSTMMDHALANDVFCICITANAKTDMLMRGRVRKPDREAEMVYATTAYVLRQKLNGFKHTDVDWLLVLVVALVGFDLAFERTQTLKAHHDALRKLTEMKGGIHAVGHTLPYVLNTDRFLAIFTGNFPIFQQSPILPTSTKGQETRPLYGEAFTRPGVSNYIDRRVLGFCSRLCKLMTVMHTARISLTPKTIPASDPSVLPYFLYLRDHLSCEGTCLHAEYHENQSRQSTAEGSQSDKVNDKTRKPLSISRCVLLALLMIEYFVFSANYYTVKIPFLADQLKSILERQSGSMWEAKSDILCWILFTLAALTEKWQHHKWATHRLSEHLRSRYQRVWPAHGWQDDELATVEAHLWSEALHASFRKVCLEVVAQHAESSGDTEGSSVLLEGCRPPTIKAEDKSTESVV